MDENVASDGTPFCTGRKYILRPIRCVTVAAILYCHPLTCFYADWSTAKGRLWQMAFFSFIISLYLFLSRPQKWQTSAVSCSGQSRLFRWPQMPIVLWTTFSINFIVNIFNKYLLLLPLILLLILTSWSLDLLIADSRLPSHIFCR